MLPTTLWAQDKSEATEFCEKERKSRSGRNCEVVVHNYVGQLNNPADRDHCLQYMTAIGLLKGNLVAEDYEDDVAKDPRIDALREKMVINEDKRYSKEYLEADKRSIANRIKIHFNDGTSTEEVEVEYPIGHKRRREEGIPVLEKKFKDNLDITFNEEVSDKIFTLCMNQEKLEETSVTDFQKLFSKICRGRSTFPLLKPGPLDRK